MKWSCRDGEEVGASSSLLLPELDVRWEQLNSLINSEPRLKALGCHRMKAMSTNEQAV